VQGGVEDWQRVRRDGDGDGGGLEGVLGGRARGMGWVWKVVWSWPRRGQGSMMEWVGGEELCAWGVGGGGLIMSVISVRCTSLL